MNITVYLGANEGNNPSLKRTVKELGTWIGKSGNALIYGGSKSGLMGALADSVLNAGGNVTGVEPQFFIENEFQHEGITKLIVTKDMSERKNKMIELGNAFIAFPGGTGTLEEITEIMSKVSLKQLNAPCIVYNLNGYYDSLKAMLKHMIVIRGKTKRNIFCRKPGANNRHFMLFERGLAETRFKYWDRNKSNSNGFFKSLPI